MPSLRQIRYFLSVAERGGFTPAATALYIAQPALSRQIALLETEIGFPLFTREARGVRLTPAGVRFRDRVQGIERSLLAAVEESRQLSNGEAGVLRLLHSSSIPVTRLLPAIRQFVESTPKARLDLDRISSEQQVSEIADGQADIGIIRLPVLHRDPSVRFLELAAERLWVALPTAHRLVQKESIALDELTGEAFVSAVHRERGGLARRVTELCLSRDFVPRLAPVISRKTSMLDLVGAGYGIAIVPESMTALCNENTACRPLRDHDAFSATALLLPLNPSPLARRFTETALNLWADASADTAGWSNPA